VEDVEKEECGEDVGEGWNALGVKDRCPLAKMGRLLINSVVTSVIVENFLFARCDSEPKSALSAMAAGRFCALSQW
jgi:hypothetical protein